MVNTMTTINIISNSIVHNHHNSNSSMVVDLLMQCQEMVASLLIIQDQVAHLMVSLDILELQVRINGIKEDGNNSSNINSLILDKLLH